MNLKGNRFQRFSNVIAIGIFFTFFCNYAQGWLAPPSVPDPELIQRSDLIVVGRIKNGSVEIVTPLPKGFIPDYRVTLVITSVLKGKEEKKELPIILHRGLAPVVNGYQKVGESGMVIDVLSNSSGLKTLYGNAFQDIDLKHSITVWAVNDIPGPVCIADMSKDQIWFVRFGNPEWRTQNYQNILGISAAQDIQPLELQPYFLAFLSDNTVEKLKSISAGNSPVAERSRHWLDHLATEKKGDKPPSP